MVVREIISDLKRANPDWSRSDLLDILNKGLRILLEHPAVIVKGKSATDDNILASRKVLKEKNLKVVSSNRGGDVTLHSEGQIVGYPVFSLARLDMKDIDIFLRKLEEALIQTLAEFGITAGRRKGLTGVWMGDEKIASIGIAVRKWITYHGFALNVRNNIAHPRKN